MTFNFVYQQLVRSPSTQSAVLCSPCIIYFKNQPQDKRYGCGYRNFQMMLSNLLCHYPILEGRLEEILGSISYRGVPDIQQIQILIEHAWNLGIDPIGAQQLNSKLIKTKKWIGTTEVASACKILGIHVLIYDFHTPTYSKSGQSFPELFQIVESYYGGCPSEGVKETNLCCIYFQHQGHSRSIIGIEKSKMGHSYLIVLDPSSATFRIEDLSNHDQYQLLIVQSVDEPNYSPGFNLIRIP